MYIYEILRRTTLSIDNIYIAYNKYCIIHAIFYCDTYHVVNFIFRFIYKILRYVRQNGIININYCIYYLVYLR